MKLTDRPQTLTIAGSELRLGRTSGGVIEIWGRDELDLARGLGFAHAYDRQTQMMLVRLVGQGRLCECLQDSDESLAIDTFMRQMGFARHAERDAERCSEAARALGEAYAAGVNEYLHRHGRVWEFRLAGYRPEPWRVADTLLTIHLMSYVGLAQTQQDLEKFLIQAVRGGVDLARLKKLFSPHLDGWNEELIDLVRRVKCFEPLVPDWNALVPAITSSNNWAVSAARSATGTALQCNDPHLESHRLPPVWYEAVLHAADDDFIGVTMPGLPGGIMGRTRSVSTGFTYGFMDMVDYFIEDVRDGKCRRGDAFVPLQTRRETIQRKKHPSAEVAVYETDRGTLECPPDVSPPADGLYLCRAYSGAVGGAAASLDSLAKMWKVQTVVEARRALRNVTISCNWIVADREGNIGFQQSGLLPARRHSGLHPVPAWEVDWTWQGLVPSDQLALESNPACGFLATANDDRNQPGKPLSINVSQGSYRLERISELLAEKDRLSLDDMRRIQSDLLSSQARRFMAVLRPLIPDTLAGALLSDWDLRYDRHSRGATLFEDFYRRTLEIVFGDGLFGRELWQTVWSETALGVMYFQRFDEIMLGEDKSWFGMEGRESLFRRVLADVCSIPPEEVRPWGESRQIVLHNLIFGGKLPGWLARLLGLDYGPVVLEGGRATIVQGAIYRSHGRRATFAPSYRFVADLGQNEAQTALGGGPSDRIGSRWYASGIADWLAFRYKTLHGG